MRFTSPGIRRGFFISGSRESSTIHIVDKSSP
nr:MAG TPA: hypothetical protein [Caudoviricetes sp.]